MTLQVCYENNGLPSGDVPCDPNAVTSACCGVGGVCVSNLNCVDPSGGSVPGTCTDQGWGSLPNPACPCPARTYLLQEQLRTICYCERTPMALLSIPG